MSDLFFRQLAGVGVFILPSAAIAFVGAWFISGFFREPRARWTHAVLAFPLAWLTVVLLAPFISRSPADFEAKGLWLVFVIAFGVGAALLFALPRIWHTVTSVSSGADKPAFETLSAALSAMGFDHRQVAMSEYANPALTRTGRGAVLLGTGVTRHGKREGFAIEDLPFVGIIDAHRISVDLADDHKAIADQALLDRRSMIDVVRERTRIETARTRPATVMNPDNPDGAGGKRTAMTIENRHLIIYAAAAIIIAGAWLGRYDITAVQHGSRSVAYVLDRWTGNVSFCTPSSCHPVPFRDRDGQ